MHWTLICMAITWALAPDGQVSEGVEVPPQGGAGSEGEVWDGHQVRRKNTEATEPDPDKPCQGKVGQGPGRPGGPGTTVDKTHMDLKYM